MKSAEFILTLKIDTKELVELSAFVGAFTALAAEYRQFSKDSDLCTSDDAQIFIKEIRQGSIIADLIPVVAAAAPLAGEAMAQVLAVEDFVNRWGRRLTELINGKVPSSVNRKGLDQFMDAVKAIARDPNASSTLESAEFIDGKRQILSSFKFSSIDARKIEETINAEYKILDSKELSEYSRVLMIFTRSDVSHAQVGKSSGERVKIDEVSDKSLALTYASELTEQRIKYQIRETDENIFKKGFVVDVRVQRKNGHPVAYSITHVHDVISLPEHD